MNEIMKKIPLKNCKETYISTIFTNNSYKLLPKCKKQIDIYNKCLKKICTNNVCDEYTYITTCKCQSTYLVVKHNDNNHLYILDEYYNEIDTIKLMVPKEYQKQILSIYYDNISNKIIITIENMVYSTTSEGNFIKNELSPVATKEIANTSVRIPNYRTCCYTHPLVQLTSASIICGELYISYIKNNSSYISSISKNGNIVSTNFIEDEIIIRQIFMVKNTINLLVVKQNKYDYIYILDKCSKQMKNTCDILGNCECRVDIPSCKPSKCNNIEDVIESVALMETALAHILNAEGEKIQKAVKIACNCCDLIKVNESVAKTISNATILEQLLVEKLSIAIEYEKCKKKDCK